MYDFTTITNDIDVIQAIESICCREIDADTDLSHIIREQAMLFAGVTPDQMEAFV